MNRVFGLSLYKILFHFKALLWESITLLLSSPTCKAYPIAILLHDHCAIYAPPPTPLLYGIHRTILAMAISCEDQVRARRGAWFGPERGHAQAAQKHVFGFGAGRRFRWKEAHVGTLALCSAIQAPNNNQRDIHTSIFLSLCLSVSPSLLLSRHLYLFL